MCDEHTELDNEQAFDAGRLSRRGFGAMSIAALAACTTAPPNPEMVAEREVTITTPDGVIDAHYVAPAAGKWPKMWGSGAYRLCLVF
ncbi:MAG: hypothetical protein NT049_18290 [Planctomycetota bacterium]|nr:hypothetical protein [Planctomycetota bacterium]